MSEEAVTGSQLRQQAITKLSSIVTTANLGDLTDTDIKFLELLFQIAINPQMDWPTSGVGSHPGEGEGPTDYSAIQTMQEQLKRVEGGDVFSGGKG